MFSAVFWGLMTIAAFTAPANCFALDDWRPVDTKRAIAFAVLDGIDWAQTRSIARNPDKFYEMNPILGRHPTVAQVNRYFLKEQMIGFGVSRLLPADFHGIPLRASWQTMIISTEVWCVSHNAQIGVTMKKAF